MVKELDFIARSYKPDNSFPKPVDVCFVCQKSRHLLGKECRSLTSCQYSPLILLIGGGSGPKIREYGLWDFGFLYWGLIFREVPVVQAPALLRCWRSSSRRQDNRLETLLFILLCGIRV